MSSYLRDYSGTIYFFTLVAFERRAIFCQDDFLIALRHVVDEVRQSKPFKVVAWVQLPDHLHCILEFDTPNAEYSKIWGMIKRKTTQACPQYHLSFEQLSVSKVLRNEQAIWQRRFYEHLIRDENDLIQHFNYIHYNPVKHGLVRSVKDWRYSTFHRHVRNGFYDENWGSGMDLSSLNHLD